MNKNLVIAVTVAAVILIGVYFAYVGFSNSQANPDGGDRVTVGGTNLNLEGDGTAGSSSQGSGDSSTENIVEITSSGFSPDTLTINAGERVTWENAGSSPSWPASDVHPSHTEYSGTSLSEHCPDTENNAFDSCGGISQGESYTFTFNKVGTWNYHDHLRPSHLGTIIVQ